MLNFLKNIFKTKNTENTDINVEKVEATKRNEPYVNIVAIYEDREGSDSRIRIELDWNSQFIKKLKENGYTGVDEQAIIQRYIAELTSDIAKDLSGTSDYE